MAKIDAFFNLMFDQKASDLHLSSGNPPILRINGELHRVDFPPLDFGISPNSMEATDSTQLLGLMVAKVSGGPFGGFLEDRIFKPLHMSNTLAYRNGRNVVPNRAYGHSAKAGEFRQRRDVETLRRRDSPRGVADRHDFGAELMRKAQNLAQGAGSTLRNGEIEILVSRREVRVRGQAVELTALEFDLLLYFAQRPGHVFSRAQLLDAVWGYSHEGYEHTVTTHINRLRAKLEADPMRPLVILTVRGAGYKMRDAPP
jgi:hypothetical protein